MRGIYLLAANWVSFSRKTLLHGVSKEVSMYVCNLQFSSILYLSY
jgi:hypothetical protein